MVTGGFRILNPFLISWTPNTVYWSLHVITCSKTVIYSCTYFHYLLEMFSLSEPSEGKKIKKYQAKWKSLLEGYVWKHRFCNSILKLTLMLLEYHSTYILREIIQFTKPHLKSYFSQYLDACLNIVHFSRSATGRQIAYFCWTNATSTNSAFLCIAVFIISGIAV